jgi:hypothetical protein
VLTESSEAASLVTSVKFYPFLEKLLRLCLPLEVQNRQGHFQLSKEKIHRRLKDSGKSRNDFMSYVLDPKLEERMSLEEIETTFNILIIAGSETTASALAGTTGYLLRYPTCLATLVKEIRGSFDEESDITLAAVGRLPYLSAVIEEGLRMAPPVPSGLPRVAPPIGATVCGEWIPGGVRFQSSHLYALLSPESLTFVFRQTYRSTNIQPTAHLSTLCGPMSFFPSDGLPHINLPHLS